MFGDLKVRPAASFLPPSLASFLPPEKQLYCGLPVFGCVLIGHEISPAVPWGTRAQLCALRPSLELSMSLLVHLEILPLFTHLLPVTWLGIMPSSADTGSRRCCPASSAHFTQLRAFLTLPRLHRVGVQLMPAACAHPEAA